MVEIEFTKERGKDRKDSLEVNIEEFIAVKGINALGNQLTKDKINQINLLDSLPHEILEEVHADEIEVVDATDVSEEANQSPKTTTDANDDISADEDLDNDDTGQATLF